MGKILFVDDEALILNSLKRGLKKKTYECYYATSGLEALKILEKIDIDVVFSDMKMPQMNGLELLRTIDNEYPDIVKIILSGYAQLPQLIATINQANIFKYVGKPWDLNQELIPIIEESLAYSQYKKEMAIQKISLEKKNEAFQKIFKTYNSKAETKSQSWDILRIYHQVLMKQLKEQIKDSSLSAEESLATIDAYKNFTDLYLNEIKKMEIYFEPVRLIREVDLFLRKSDHHIKFDVIEDASEMILFEGRGIHIKPILIGLIENLTDVKTIGTVKIMTKASPKENDRYTVSYILEASSRTFYLYNENSYVFKLYKALLNIFGGDLEFKVSNEKIGIILTAQLFYKDESE